MPTISQLRTDNNNLINPAGTVKGIRAVSHRQMNTELIDKLEENENAIEDVTVRLDSVEAGELNANPSSTPTSGIDTYNANVAGTYTNFGGLVVTSDDLEEGKVQLRRTDGVWSKVIIPNPQLNTGIFDPESTNKAETGKSISDYMLVNDGLVYDNVMPGTYGDSQEYANVAGAWTTGIVPATEGASFRVLCSVYTAIVVKYYNGANNKILEENVESGDVITAVAGTYSIVVVAVNGTQPTMSVAVESFGFNRDMLLNGVKSDISNSYNGTTSGTYASDQTPVALSGYWSSNIIRVKKGDKLNIQHSPVFSVFLKFYDSTPTQVTVLKIVGNDEKDYEIPEGISSVVITFENSTQPSLTVSQQSKITPWQVNGEFNILDYGAVGDGVFDNTAIFSKVLKDLIAYGGGRMRIPRGVFKGNIKIPLVPSNRWTPIEISGDYPPSPIFGTIGTFPMPYSACTIISTSTTNDLLSCEIPSSGYPFSFISVYLKNLDIRTYQNPQVNAINLGGALQAKAENLQITTGVYSVDAVEPTYNTSGLITPAKDNGALTILDNVAISGYKNGIEVNEHTDGRGINITCCYNGLLFKTAPHSSHFGRICMQRNRNNVVVEGVHRFSIDQLNLEHANAATGQTNPTNEWQLTQSDIRDAGNLGVADINWAVVLGDVGIDNTFTKIGGTGIKTRAIGS